jgi:uncharacterized protein YabE (DUF348 family)
MQPLTEKAIRTFEVGTKQSEKNQEGIRHSKWIDTFDRADEQ